MLLAGAVLIGCGGVEEGFSGAPLDERVGDLSDDDMRKLCAWGAQRQGGENAMFDCGDGVSVTIDTVDECVEEQTDYAFCDATVQQMEQCVIDAGPNPCNALTTPACEPLYPCWFGV